MNELISITNFLVIKKAEVNIKKINVIIGPQANGKSVIAKLVYFYKSMSSNFIKGIRTAKTKRELDSEILSDFEERFPRYSWEGTNFIIRYKLGDIEIVIDGKKGARGKTLLNINYSENIIKLFNSKKKLYKKKVAEATEQQKKSSRRSSNISQHVFYEHIIEPLNRSEFGAFFSNPVFIPASRTFFANLQKNIFTFLASNLDIDPYLKEFGS
jgi:hypothetical protein